MERSGNLTGAQVQEILRLYPDCPAAEIARRFGRPVSTVYKTAQRYGIRKSEDFLNSPLSGRIRNGKRLSPETEWKKGHIPATKDKKLADICKSKEAFARSVSSRWKKGNKPQTTKYDGAVTVRRFHNHKSGDVFPYKWIRVAEGKWEFLHRHIWVTAHGDIPDGHNVVFRDGNTLNCTLDNLECISNTELMERNRNSQYPLEMKRLIVARNKLSRTLKNKKDE